MCIFICHSLAIFKAVFFFRKENRFLSFFTSPESIPLKSKTFFWGGGVTLFFHLKLPPRLGICLWILGYYWILLYRVLLKSEYFYFVACVLGYFWTKKWWRRRESNPRPRKFHTKYLQV